LQDSQPAERDFEEDEEEEKEERKKQVNLLTKTK
jgi:hypothetical protein